MPVLTVLGAKGGVGASIVATNLGAALAHSSRCVVIDLHLACPADDLLLNLGPRGTWLDLLPVADQLTERHLELTVAGHDTGPGLLGAPTQAGLPVPLDAVVGLLGGLDRVFGWVVADVAPGVEPLSLAAAEASHLDGAGGDGRSACPPRSAAGPGGTVPGSPVKDRGRA